MRSSLSEVGPGPTTGSGSSRGGASARAGGDPSPFHTSYRVATAAILWNVPANGRMTEVLAAPVPAALPRRARGAGGHLGLVSRGGRGIIVSVPVLVRGSGCSAD